MTIRRISTYFVLALCLLLVTADAADAQIRHLFDVRTPMRDGVELSSDVWLPEAEGRYPVILIRCPYMKDMVLGDFSLADVGRYFAERGYVVVSQDVRGRGDSDGVFDFFFADAEDGYDTIEWIAKQPWSNGDVGMIGWSYLATVQWLAARERPPHLTCITSTAPAGDWFDEIPYQGGAFHMEWALNWTNDTSGRSAQVNATGVDWMRVFAHRPLLTMDEAIGRRIPLYREFLEHSTFDAYWKRIWFTPEDFAGIDLPVMHVTGWFDGDQPGAMYYWNGMRNSSPAADRQFLIVGPWEHSPTFVGGALEVGELKFSGDSVIDNMATHLAFFDHYLKGTGPEPGFPRARLYITGTNEWRSFDHYPPVEAEEQSLYLHSGGRANSSVGDGELSWRAPGDQPPDRFTYDPKHPVFEMGFGAGADRRSIQRRDDVLVYTSAKLEQPLTIAGEVFMELYATTDVLDTDFMVQLNDVFPDGRSVALSWRKGVVRARYRNGYETEVLLTPGTTEKYRIRLFHMGHTFLPGHRIRLEVTSSASPMINPNQNTGNPVATDTEWKTAHQVIHHDAEHPSRLILPVLED
jgi:putative CocE/NonD family hydrolase